MKPCTLFFALALGACARGPQINGTIGHSELTSAPAPPPPREAVATDLELVAGAADLCRTGTSLAVDRADDEALARLARCLVSDEAKPATIVLIGRELGPASYDVDLGLRRAVHVKELLVARGVPEERIVATSSSEAVQPGSARVDLVIAFPPAPHRTETPIRVR
jgi:hypothetical protein